MERRQEKPLLPRPRWSPRRVHAWRLAWSILNLVEKLRSGVLDILTEGLGKDVVLLIGLTMCDDVISDKYTILKWKEIRNEVWCLCAL